MSGCEGEDRENSSMSLAHFTLPTRELEKTARFFEATLGYARPAESPG